MLTVIYLKIAVKGQEEELVTDDPSHILGRMGRVSHTEGGVGALTLKFAKTLLFMVCALALIGLSGCDSPRSKIESAGSTEAVTISTYPAYHSTLVWIARNRGYFSEHGINVQLRIEESGVASLHQLLAGKADLATLAEFVFVSHFSDRPDIRILAHIAQLDNTQLVARTDHGITQISDLRNKRIGLVGYSAADYYLHLLLTFHRVSSRDVQIVDLSPSDQAKALTKGEIDAVVVWPPFADSIRDGLGANAISWSAQQGQDYYWLLVGVDDTLKKRSAEIRGVLAALASAEDFMKSQPDEAKRIVASELGSNVRPELWESAKFGLGLDRPCLLAMEAEFKWMQARHGTQGFKMPNFLDYIHFDALKSVRPDQVQMLH